MNGVDLIAALNLPASAKVDRRVPKKLLLENGAPTLADKRHINDGIEELFWVAALKPTTIGIPEYSDAEREYLEIAVLRFTLRVGAKVTRLMELVHRAVPYPLMLLTENTGQMSFSTVHKRWAQNEVGKAVLDGDVIVADWEMDNHVPYFKEFRNALALERQPHGTLRALYQGWMDTLIAFNAARLTGRFNPAVNPEQAKVWQEALRECARLELEMAHLRAAARKENQMARKVQLNFQLRLLSSQMRAQRALL